MIGRKPREPVLFGALVLVVSEWVRPVVTALVNSMWRRDW
ncbi:Uncharacterised protein [Mycobacteroides abscessus subsp. abscessus]|nr:Uncharacterised protein [Mycobacteroides abscessus subsp. abscessus]